ncbi:phosphoribosyltransferase [Patescibacteria group bacterium]
MFKDRRQAGRKLAAKLASFKGRVSLVLGIPRGGIVVAKEISEHLGIPLACLVVKKVPALEQPEFAIGAVTSENIFIGKKDLASEKKVKEYTSKFGQVGGRDIIGKSVILVDDGVATGATVKVAIKYLRKKKVKEIILAVPVISPDILEEIELSVKKVVALETPEDFSAVGQFFQDFPQVDDEEVVQLLQK